MTELGPGEAAGGGWQFFIDRGGTFTDIVAKRPDGSLISHKLLSENPGRYEDAALFGMRELLGLAPDQPLAAAPIAAVKMGTTVATNALLTRGGARTLLLVTRGFKDALRIGYQNRPRLFDRRIVLPDQLYERVLEVDERVGARGEVVRPLELPPVRAGLRAALEAGIRSVAIVLMHGYRFPAHEQALSRLAHELGFEQVSASHEVSPLAKLVSRGDTTVVDAYLSPVLERHVERVRRELGGSRLSFMRSNGGLAGAAHFRGRDSILSGPAGGVVGAVRTALAAGFERVIGFDMGGTSTDVSHYDGEYERSYETEIAGVRLRVPMLGIHTVAAGGGSILRFDGQRYRVGPESAGADPGPACYRRGGPLTVTDCNVMLGKIRPAYFPALFGRDGRQPIDVEIVRQKFAELARAIEAAGAGARSPAEIAEGFIEIASLNMARAIKKISVERGHDVTAYTLCCFGGAGGQHACRVADALGMRRVLIHEQAGVLSAYGMGLAELTSLRERSVDVELADENMPALRAILAALGDECRAELAEQGVAPAAIRVVERLHLRYAGTDATLGVAFDGPAGLRAAFEAQHRRRYGFVLPERGLIVAVAEVLAEGGGDSPRPAIDAPPPRDTPPEPEARVHFQSEGRLHAAPVYRRERLRPGDRVEGPAIIAESNATTVVEPGWRATIAPGRELLLERVVPLPARKAIGTHADPVMLEVFNSLFMSIAEQMGATLANTAHSVNIKERLDFSCAIFDRDGLLIANAPHVPVHLGSMGESVRAVIRANQGRMRAGDVYCMNDPYSGGTHLPDITVVTPVFDASGAEILFYVGSRGHHADVGGITPGSIPPASRRIEEEGLLIENFVLVSAGRFREAELRALLGSGRFPARNPDQNLADLRAQVAANETGARELLRMVQSYGADVVRAYMRHVRDNAEHAVRSAIERLEDGRFEYEMDSGARVSVAVRVDRAARSAVIDFAGTSPEQPDNFNAPASICRAAVLYVFRTLVDDEIPLNDGCFAPLRMAIPEGSLLMPRPPAAVVSGNVETSQCVTDCLYGALGVMAASQGTMNNFTFGNERHQYYETICGGAGAGPDFDGASAVHTHMTNSRLTDPEVLELRFPVRLEDFSLRTGSGGAGAHRGGDGVRRAIRFLEPMTAAILSGRRRVPPYGMAGGEPGEAGRNRVIRADGASEELGASAEVSMEPGDVFVIETPGGGGYGPPGAGANGGRP